MRAKNISQSIDRLPTHSLSRVLLEVLIGPKKGHFSLIRMYSECFSTVIGIVLVLLPLAVYKNIFSTYFNTCSKKNIPDITIADCRFASKLIFNYLLPYLKLKLTNNLYI